MEENKAKALTAALAQIEKQFGKGAIMKMGETEVDKGVDVVSTGSLGLDVALGVGGLPRGRVVEIYGPESSGKTTLTLQVVAEMQKMGGVAAFIDAEHALDPDPAKRRENMQYVVDGLVNQLAEITGEVAGYTRLLQTGRVQNYLLIAATGAVLLALAYVFRFLGALGG